MTKQDYSKQLDAKIESEIAKMNAAAKEVKAVKKPK